MLCAIVCVRALSLSLSLSLSHARVCRWRTKLPSKSELALYMPPKGANIHKNRGVCMELERTLASYRPKPDVRIAVHPFHPSIHPSSDSKRSDI